MPPSDSPVGQASGPVDRLASHPPRKPPSEALQALLVDLGSQIQRGTSREAADAAPGARFHPTGFAELDACLGGGFPNGRLSEICGASESLETAALSQGSRLSPGSRLYQGSRLSQSSGPSQRSGPSRRSGLSAGRTSLALGLVSETLSRGGLAAWIDLADAFAPEAALTALKDRGSDASDLERLLWIRARNEDEALRCCERVMRTEGFELVVFDLFRPQLSHSQAQRRSRPRTSSGKSAQTVGAVPQGRGAGSRQSAPQTRRAPTMHVKDVTWLRLARLAAGTRTALVALSSEASTGSRAELVLEMQIHATHFGGPPHLLETIETRAVLRRHRSRPNGETLLLLRTENSYPDEEPCEQACE